MTISQVVKQVAKQVVTKAKAVVSTTSQVLTQLKENVSQFVSTTAQTISSGVQYVASVAQETYQTVTQQIIPTVSRYITDKVKSVATKVEQDWEATKDALETGLKACIQAKKHRIRSCSASWTVVAGTLIATTLGVVSIEQIQPGMTVYAMDEESGTIVSNQVVQTFERETKEAST